MTGMTPGEADRFFEDDEDPTKVFAAFDAARKGITAPPVTVKLTGPYLQPALTSHQCRGGKGVKLEAAQIQPILAASVRA
jgi:hypothetical protein